MKRIFSAFAVLSAFLIPLLAAAPAEAQATRTWVSGVGDDANPCSRTAPCKTFAGAISKTAAGGEIDALDPGGFGAVTLTKAITLNGGGGQVASILVSGTPAVVVAAGASDVVTIRNLSIDGLGTGTNGIAFNTGGTLNIENCDIFGFNVGVSAVSSSTNSELMMTNDLLRTNTTGAVQLQPGGGQAMKATLDHVTLTHNGWGVEVLDNVNADVSNSNVSGNTSAGIFANSASVLARVNVEHTEITNNNAAGVASYGVNGSVRLSDDAIYDNVEGIGGTGEVVSFGNNRIFSNSTNGAPTATTAQH